MSPGGVEVPGSFDGPPSGFGSFRMRLLLQEGETRELGATPLPHEATLAPSPRCPCDVPLPSQK